MQLLIKYLLIFVDGLSCKCVPLLFALLLAGTRCLCAITSKVASLSFVQEVISDCACRCDQSDGLELFYGLNSRLHLAFLQGSQEICQRGEVRGLGLVSLLAFHYPGLRPKKGGRKVEVAFAAALLVLQR